MGISEYHSVSVLEEYLSIVLSCSSFTEEAGLRDGKHLYGGGLKQYRYL